MKQDLSKSYFDWLFSKVYDQGGEKVKSHRKLLNALFEFPFKPTNPLDQAREEDGIDLRWRYYWENFHIDDNTDISIYNFNPNMYHTQCSVLEMMVALAFRADENFTREHIHRSSVPDIFWEMITNMGLIAETDPLFDIEYVTLKLERFISRTYEPNGRGGLFYFKNIDTDIREVEIWYQLCWYVNEKKSK